MDEANKIITRRSKQNVNITMTDLQIKQEKIGISLRKERMFNNIMAKRGLKSSILNAGNILSDNTFSIQKETKNKTIASQSQLQSYHLLSQLPTSDKLLMQLKQGYYIEDKTELYRILQEINQALSDEVMIEVLTDMKVIKFIIQMFLNFDSEGLFYLFSSILVSYTFNTDTISIQLNSVKVLDKILYEAFYSFYNINLINNILIIIWNIYNDLGNSIISKTQLLYYLTLMIISDEQLETKSQKVIKEAIVLNLFVLTNNPLISLKPQIIQIIPFLVNEINTAGEKNCDQFIYVLTILYSLSNDDEICELLLKEGVINCLCDLFRYLFLDENEIFLKKILVLHPKCVTIILKLFSNFFCLPDEWIAEMLSEDLFFLIIMQLIKIYSNDSRHLNENTLFSNIQIDLLALVANISACDISSLMNFIGQEDLIQTIFSSFVMNHEGIIHIIHIIENIFLKNNIKAIMLLRKYSFVDIINRVLAENSFHPNVKIDALRVLILLIQKFESKEEYPFNFLMEIEQNNIIHYTKLLHDQSNNTQLTNCCSNFITMLNQINSSK